MPWWANGQWDGFKDLILIVAVSLAISIVIVAWRKH